MTEQNGQSATEKAKSILEREIHRILTNDPEWFGEISLTVEIKQGIIRFAKVGAISSELLYKPQRQQKQ